MDLSQFKLFVNVCRRMCVGRAYERTVLVFAHGTGARCRSARHFANNHSNGTTPAPRTVTGCPDLVCPGTGASQSSSAGRSAVRSIVFDVLRSPAACQCRMRDDGEHALERSRERRMWQGGRPRRELVPPPSRQSVAATCGETCRRSCRARQALMDPVAPDKRTCPPPLPALPGGDREGASLRAAALPSRALGSKLSLRPVAAVAESAMRMARGRSRHLGRQVKVGMTLGMASGWTRRCGWGRWA